MNLVSTVQGFVEQGRGDILQGFIQRGGGAHWDLPPPPKIKKNYDVIITLYYIYDTCSNLQLQG